MITLEQAKALRAAGVTWQPRDGDHFAIPGRDLDQEVFVVSHMVVDLVDTPVGPLLAFNGTTEWALDSIEVDEVVWLPLEHQLRALLGDAFVGLELLPGGVGDVGSAGSVRGYAVTARVAGGERRYVDLEPDLAYARALLDLLAA